jgi:hypothetical protein
MTLTTPVQERYTASCARIHNVGSSIGLAKATSHIGRGQERTSTSNGYAVQHATGSSRNGRAPS